MVTRWLLSGTCRGQEPYALIENQMKISRRTFLGTTAASAGCLAANTVWSASPIAASAVPDADLLAQARQRIEQHRKADGVISVRDAAGKPIRGATIRVEQLRHEFRFGCNFFMFGRVQEPELEEEYRRRFAALLNYATLGFYWGAYESQRGKPNYDYTDKVVAWAREHGITCKGHPLAWDHPASSPKWLPDDTAKIERLSTVRVREIVARFKERINMWDVVNEPTDLKRFKNPMNIWANQLGAVPFTKLHLKVAHATNPNATLLVNDYRTDAAYFKILNALREDGKLMFDALGIQSHMHDSTWKLPRIWEVCDTYARLGVPIHFTESTVVSGPRKGPGENWNTSTPDGEAKQADYVPNFYTMLFAHPAVEALTWWDFADRGAWQGAPAGWLRKDMSPKPVYDRLLSLIKREWWTKLDGRTDEHGEFSTRAFAGVHRITAELPAGRTTMKDVAWERGKQNQVLLAA
jgi:endo-1,4-beta-xylanase